jgi:Protein of unknown function (DUF1111).
MQVGAGPDDSTFDQDAVADPEMPISDLGDIVTFSKFLAPAPRKPMGSEEVLGETLFFQMNCVSCHVPQS